MIRRKRDEQLLEAGRAEDAKRRLAAVQLIGLEQAGYAEVVVGVVVGDVEVVDLDEPGRALHLALSAFAAVDEDAIPAGAHKQARRRPPSRRHGAPGAEKDNVEVHEGESNGGVRRLCTAAFAQRSREYTRGRRSPST